jgi:pimeloyl-ACP methyl ester carboxylesterase
MNTIVVLLPGIAGSNLTTGGLLPQWPIQILAKVTEGDEQEAFAMANDPKLKPSEPTLWSFPVPLHLEYGKFRHYFELAGFTSCVFSSESQKIPQDHPEKLLVGFAYDWRQDNGGTPASAGSAGDLRTLLSAIDAAYHTTEYRVFLVGHSMGGLVSRAYLENPVYQKDAWYGKIAALITLGTPHLGAPLAVDAITGKVTMLSTRYDEFIQDFVNHSFSVSAYELLPPLNRKFIKCDGTDYSLFDSEFQGTPAWTWLRDQGMNTDKIARAGQFFGELTYAAQKELPPYYCAYGISPAPVTCESFTCDSESGELMEWRGADGDMVVPEWSASFEGREVAGTYKVDRENHLGLPGNPEVLRQVFAWMNVTAPVIHFADVETNAGVPA